MSRKQIVAWYREFDPIRLDLVGDYAGTSRFMIHGDSLLRQCFNDRRIDFSPGGFQILHAVYVVEQFLHGFVRRKCVFDIVFLQSTAKLCIPSGQGDNAAKWMCAREIVIKHLLGLQREDGQVKVFASVLDGEFQQWITDRRPLFVMATDGNDSATAATNVDDYDSDSQDDDDDIDSEDDSCYSASSMGEDLAGEDSDNDSNAQSLAAKIMLHRFLGMGYNVGLINRVEFVDSKIFTYVLECAEPRLPLRNAPSESEGIKTSMESSEKFLEVDGITSLRERLTIHALVKLLGPNCSKPLPKSVAALAAIFLLHTALLRSLSLEERQSPSHEISKHKRKNRADEFLYRIAQVTFVLLDGFSPESEAAEGSGDLCDFLDGRLFVRLATQGIGEPSAEALKDFSRLARAVEKGLRAVGRNLTLELPASSSEMATPATDSDSEDDPPPFTILPFSNPIFDPHLQSIKLDVDEDIMRNSPDATVYEEKTHWHNSKKRLSLGFRQTTVKPVNRSLGGKGQPENRWDRIQMGRARKSDQRQLDQMQRYAASLTASVDGILENQKLIIYDPKARPGKQTAINKNSEKPVKPGKDTPISKAEKIRLENSSKAAAKEAKALMNAWKTICQELDSSRDDEASISRLDEHMKKIQRTLSNVKDTQNEGRFVELEIRIYKIQLLQKIWVRLLKEGQKGRGFAVLAALFEEGRKALSSPVLTVQVQSILDNLFEELGIARPPSALPSVQIVKRDLSFKTQWNGTHGEDFELGMSSEEFQLMNFGPYMDRNMDSKPDDRVPFEPDGWQRKVLDEIDNENSVFVVAPTSAGKTFISFHAMEKVLKGSDDGILVYVAPTKALVNQIAAEVISRFRKNYKTSGKTVWAIHTRDYRIHNPNNCQILITVPHILSIMLLSPSNAEKWSPRVKRIIFDEVHSIGNAEEGVVWEQLLLLAPCPIIALSATVGNSEEFNAWLKGTQRSQLTMIKHEHRYSDLRKFVYYPPAKSTAKEPFAGLPSVEKFGYLDGAPGLEVIHPIASLVDATQEIPDDLALEPRDCISLYKCMKTLETKDYRVPEHLDYHQIFGKSGMVIKKADVIPWEADLKNVLKHWMCDENSPFKRLIKKLGSNISPLPVTSGFPPPTKDAGNTANDSENDDPLLKWGTLSLLSTLHAENALPAILFSYDRKLCDSICLSLCEQLERGEKDWRSKDQGWQTKIKEWEAWKKAKTSRALKPRKLDLQGKTKTDIMIEEAQKEHHPFESFDPSNPSPAFTFADTKKCSQAELEEEINLLNPGLVSSPLVQALQRGIGVHHAGLNLKYRQAVETLFRKGYLRVVIATGTLALGINMPCKTVIFAGDTVYLTALNYRQGAGRAGRRGFDLLGNVIFHNISVPRVQRLMSSRLPSLLGHFPISTSLVLRLFILLHNSKQSMHAQNCINSLLTQPRLIIGGNPFKEQMLHHLRFSIEFLRRQQLLSVEGTPLNFAGLITHMYYHEASAFSLHAVLCSSYIHELCKGIHKQGQQKHIGRELMLLMAHIFCRRPLSQSDKCPRLPPMPKAVQKTLQRYNEDILQTYTAYVETYAKQYCNSADNILPFSKIRCGGSGVAIGGTARSSFVALSGHTGGFSDVADLVSSVRSDIFLEGGSVPHLPISPGAGLNGYLYSFFKDGDVIKLSRQNGIRQADVWFVLKDFSLVLATVVAGLECYLRDGSGAYFNMNDDEEEIELSEGIPKCNPGYELVLAAFRMVKYEFEVKFRKTFA